MIITALQRSILRTSAPRSRLYFLRVNRNFTSLPPPPPHHAATAHPASMLGTLTGELDKLAPRFEIRANQIRILRAPEEFYETLKVIGWFLYQWEE